jgi:pilus assembly protein Flp/PilA
LNDLQKAPLGLSFVNAFASHHGTFASGQARYERASRPKRSTPMSKLVAPKLIAFLRNESGATAIEYGLIAAGISVAIIAVVNGLGTSLNTKFSDISTQLK